MRLGPLNGIDQMDTPVEKLPQLTMLVSTINGAAKKTSDTADNIGAVRNHSQSAWGQLASLANRQELSTLRRLGGPHKGARKTQVGTIRKVNTVSSPGGP